MPKAVAGPTISLGDVAESPADWRFRHRKPADRKGVSCLSFGR